MRVRAVLLLLLLPLPLLLPKVPRTVAAADGGVDRGWRKGLNLVLSIEIAGKVEVRRTAAAAAGEGMTRRWTSRSVEVGLDGTVDLVFDRTAEAEAERTPSVEGTAVVAVGRRPAEEERPSRC